MRLIDADVLKIAIRKKFQNLWDRIEINGLINEQPTIEAEDVRRGMCIDCIIHDESTAEAEQLRNALILMVLQYCTDDDGCLWNRCMSAGEAAFRVLGVKNGDSADELWAKMESEVE